MTAVAPSGNAAGGLSPVLDAGWLPTPDRRTRDERRLMHEDGDGLFLLSLPL
jgi:hypothetical protein